MHLEQRLKESLLEQARDKLFGSEENIILTPQQFIDFYEQLQIFPPGVLLDYDDESQFITASKEKVLSRIPWGKNRLHIRDFTQLGFLLLLETWDVILAEENEYKEDPLGSMIEDRNRVIQEIIERI